MMIDFQINRGLSTELFINGQVNPDLIIEEGCWYLCTDTAELFLGVKTEEGLTLKQVNDAEAHPVVAEVKAQVTGLIPKVEEEIVPTIEEVKSTTEELKAWVDNKDFLQHIDLDGYATEEYVTDVINNINTPEAELFKVDFNAPNYAEAVEAYNSGKVLVLINAAPDINSYAVMNYVSDKYIAFTKFLMSRSETYGAFNTYYLNTDNTWEVAKEVKLNKVEANISGEITNDLTSIKIGKEIYNIPSIDGLASTEYVDKVISEIEFPDEFITESELENKGFITDISGKADVEHKHSITDIEDYMAPNLDEYAKTSDIPDVSGFATKIELNEAINAIEHPSTDLTNYVTKDELNDYLKEIPSEYVTESELEAKGYLTEHQSLENYTTKQDVADAIAGIEIPETNLDNYYTKDETTSTITAAVVQKADKILFNTDKFVNTPYGNFAKGDNIADLTIAELFAKLLGLSDEFVDNPDTPIIPDEPSSLIEEILVNTTSMYSITANGELVEVPFQELNGQEPPTASGFFVIRNENREIVEAGYQDLSAVNDEMYYIIALPKKLDYNTMVALQIWDADEKIWIDAEMPLISEPAMVADLCNEVGVDLSHINTDLYTVWLYEDICTGSILRYVIKEDK